MPLPEIPIAAPPVAPAKHGLLDSAFPVEPSARIGDLWEMGCAFVPELVTQVEVIPANDVGPGGTPGPATDRTEDTELDLGSLIQLTPYTLTAPYQRRGVDWPWAADTYRSRAERIMIAGRSITVETELWSGAEVGEAGRPGAGNPQLTNSNTFTASGEINAGTAMPPRLALAALVQATTDHPNAGRAMIHATPQTAMCWWQTGSLLVEGDRLVTAVGGHIVVAGPGYPGTGPDNAARTDPAHHWAYVTSPVHYLLGVMDLDPEEFDEAFSRRENRLEFIARQTVIPYWDLQLHAAVNVDTTAALD